MNRYKVIHKRTVRHMNATVEYTYREAVIVTMSTVPLSLQGLLSKGMSIY